MARGEKEAEKKRKPNGQKNASFVKGTTPSNTPFTIVWECNRRSGRIQVGKQRTRRSSPSVTGSTTVTTTATTKKRSPNLRLGTAPNLKNLTARHSPSDQGNPSSFPQTNSNDSYYLDLNLYIRGNRLGQEGLSEICGALLAASYPLEDCYFEAERSLLRGTTSPVLDPESKGTAKEQKERNRRRQWKLNRWRAARLKRCRRIGDLDLRDNGISDAGFVELAQTLLDHPEAAPKRILVSGNGMSAAAAAYMKEALAVFAAEAPWAPVPVVEGLPETQEERGGDGKGNGNGKGSGNGKEKGKGKGKGKEKNVEG